jgi:hypothetical protein
VLDALISSAAGCCLISGQQVGSSRSSLHGLHHAALLGTSVCVFCVYRMQMPRKSRVVIFEACVARWTNLWKLNENSTLVVMSGSFSLGRCITAVQSKASAQLHMRQRMMNAANAAYFPGGTSLGCTGGQGSSRTAAETLLLRQGCSLDTASFAVEGQLH